MNPPPPEWTTTCPTTIGFYWFLGSVWGGKIEATIVERKIWGIVAHGQLVESGQLQGAFFPVALPDKKLPLDMKQRIYGEATE